VIGDNSLSFEEALDFIYDRFRSEPIHEALPAMSSERLSRQENKYVQIEYLGGFYSLNKGKKWINLKPSDVLGWFSQVVKESLVNYLVNSEQERGKAS
jgi:hypothetical protein